MRFTLQSVDAICVILPMGIQAIQSNDNLDELVDGILIKSRQVMVSV